MSFAKIMKFLKEHRGASRLPDKTFSLGRVDVTFSNDDDISSVTVGSEDGSDNFDCFGFYSLDSARGMKKTYFSCSPQFDALCRSYHEKPRSKNPKKDAMKRIKQAEEDTKVEVEDLDVLLAKYAEEDGKRESKSEEDSSDDDDSKEKKRKKKKKEKKKKQEERKKKKKREERKKKEEKDSISDSSDEENEAEKTSKKLSLSWKNMKPVNTMTTTVDKWNPSMLKEGTHILRTYLYKDVFPVLEKTKGDDLGAVFTYAAEQIDKEPEHYHDVAHATVQVLGRIIKGHEKADIRKMEDYLQEAQNYLRDQYDRKDIFSYGFAASSMLSGYASTRKKKGRFKALTSGKGSLAVAKANLGKDRIKGFSYPDSSAENSDDEGSKGSGSDSSSVSSEGSISS